MRFVRIFVGFTTEGRHTVTYETRSDKIGNFSLNAASFSDILRCLAMPVCTGIEPLLKILDGFLMTHKCDLESHTSMWLCNRGVNPLVSTVSGHPQFLALWQRRNHILADEGTTSFIHLPISSFSPIFLLPSSPLHSLFSCLSSSYPVPSAPSPSHPFLPSSLHLSEAARESGRAV